MVGRESIGAILLAAGASSRMGRPKPLLEYEGETFLDRQIGLYGQVAGRVVCVLGYQAETIAAGLKRAGEATLVLNARPARGQLSSLQCGLRALPGGLEAVFFLPVDSPGCRVETLRRLVEAWAEARPAVVVPVDGGRHGHPVLVSTRLMDEFLALKEGATARDVIHAHRAETLYVETGDAAIHFDIDDAAAYRALLGELSQ